MKTLYLLIGPKGAGKTHIGQTIERTLQVPFLRVEPIWLSLRPGENGWKRVEAEIDRLFVKSDQLMIESLGAGEGFQSMRSSLSRKYRLKYVKVAADLNECLKRVKTRCNKDHIPVSESRVEQYNEIASRVELPWDAVIQNGGPASVEEIIGAFQRIR